MYRLCVIGNPVAHSRSPAIHTALLRQRGLEGVYTTVTVREGELEAFVAEARRGKWDGFNVTMPHKQAILPLLDAVEGDAAAMRAVNTVVVRQGRAVGYNTDGEGFVRSLPFTASGKRVLVLGSGGAASAVSRALRRCGAAVTICCRHPEKTAGWNMETQLWRGLPLLAADCDLLVNATPLGMTGQEEFADFRFLENCHGWVYDLVYQPRETALLAAARDRGLPVIGGLALLHAQAELAFELFVGE